eukprot:4025467-Prymnesium_polylepis.1
MSPRSSRASSASNRKTPDPTRRYASSCRARAARLGWPGRTSAEAPGYSCSSCRGTPQRTPWH